MIQDQNRSGWFGASDTDIIMGNWKTTTFSRWWAQKLGINTLHFSNPAINAGTYYEHAILEAVGAPRMDHQIILPELKLRVNLDGDGPGRIYEVKTHKLDKPFKVSKAYWQQVLVQMYAKQVEEGCTPLAHIVAYGLEPEDYRNFFREIDPERLTRHSIEYDAAFIDKYLARMEYLARRLEKGEWP